MNKAALRRQYRVDRQAIGLPAAVTKNARIAANVQGLVDWHTIHKVHAYQSQIALNEVDTSWLGPFLAGLGLPIELTMGDSHKNALLPGEQYDLIIVPLIAFDEHCHRLGFGSGWYDRFLAAQPQALAIGVAFDVQQYSPGLPVEQHDIRMSYIVTETRVIGA